MKLNEALDFDNNERIETLALQFLDAAKNGNNKKMEKVKGTLAITLMNSGWLKPDVSTFLKSLESVNNIKDVTQLLASKGIYGEIREEAPSDPINTFKVIIVIGAISKENIQSEIKALIMFLKKKNIKIVKYKLKDQIPFDNPNDQGNASPTDGKEPKKSDPYYDLEIGMIIKTRKEKSDLYNCIQPAYELFDVVQKH